MTLVLKFCIFAPILILLFTSVGVNGFNEMASTILSTTTTTSSPETNTTNSMPQLIPTFSNTTSNGNSSGILTAAAVVENNDTLDEAERRYHELQQPAHGDITAMMRGKLNIVDLFPMKVEDFYDPRRRDSNAKQTHDDTIKQRQNEVNLDDDKDRTRVIKPPIVKPLRRPNTQLKEQSINLDNVADEANVSDFTGKLLAERDGAITEIEQKFQLNENIAGNEPVSERSVPEIALTHAPDAEIVSTTFNTQHDDNGNGHLNYADARAASTIGQAHFIDRRVKKSFEFPMHRITSDAMPIPHFDFANTKFTGSANKNPPSTITPSHSLGGSITVEDSKITVGAHPEFSTTKFYNSKELYNEIMLHTTHQQLSKLGKPSSIVPSSSIVSGNGNGASTSAASRFAVVKGKGLTLHFTQNDKSKIIPTTTISTTSTALPSTIATGDSGIMRVSIKPTTSAVNKFSNMPASTSTTIFGTTTTDKVTSTTATTPLLLHSDKPLKQSNELRRAKLLLKTLLSASNGATSTTTTVSAKATATGTTATTSQSQSFDSVSIPSTHLPTSANINSTTIATTIATHTNSPSPPLASNVTTMDIISTNTPVPKSQYPISNSATKISAFSKPLIRPRIHISNPLQEKINALDCGIQMPQPNSSHLWRGNETHELLLPIISMTQCRNEEDDCRPAPASAMSWEGEAEIQSGDILIVEINDAALLALYAEAKRASDTSISSNINITNVYTTQVYQVTRNGHEHCDVTEGTLLDITPLMVDGRKLVTLYDKDLTEGVNLLIVVSELWGTQCVRLKVITKTDNCGESAECSSKGVCYSNPSMEEYDCQCCSGFTGQHCEEIDACTPSPCTNNGICVDLSQGHDGNAYQCLCPYGYAGKNCQYEADPCNPAECLNGGSCIGNSTHFRCDCAPGFAGPMCQHSLNECESSPCVHGICVDQEDGFRCFCQPGFAGELCNVEYNECESNPCQNNGECIDHIGSYECRCNKGYTGSRCHIKVDFCAHKPCPVGRRCVDRGNDFICMCESGGEHKDGHDCNQLGRILCKVNTCSHGGTCWSTGADAHYCACRPGFTGTLCEDEFVVETVVSASEFLVDDAYARSINEKSPAFEGNSATTTSILKSPVGDLHNAYFAAALLAAGIFIVAIVVIICQCRSNQTYRKFSSRATSTSTFLPILGFGQRNNKTQNKRNRHWLIGGGVRAGSLRNVAANAAASTKMRNHLPATYNNRNSRQQQQTQGDPLCERPTSLHQQHFARHLENDFYYTANFSEHHSSQHSSLID